MARKQSENYPEIRREILRRAASIFARQGYASSTIGDIAATNEISRGLLYHYFESKEALLREMLSEHLDMLLAEVHAASKRGSDMQACLRNTIRAMIRINARSKDLQVVLLHDLQNLRPPDRKRIVRKQKDILAAISALIKAYDNGRSISDRTLMAHTMMFMGMINYTYLWYDPDGPVGPEEYADMVADTCLAKLRA